MSKTMTYVAADPKQPGAAWAICVDNPDRAKDVAKLLGQWIRKGATVMHVESSVGVEMLKKWVAP